MALKEKEKKLIVALRKNGRKKIKKFANEKNIPVSTMFDVLKRLEKKKIIQHSSSLAFEEIGFPFRIFVTVRTMPQVREDLKEYLLNSKNVNTIHEIDTGFDFHFEAVFKNPKNARDFMTDFEEKNSLIEIRTYNIIANVCKEKFLTEDSHFD